MAKTKVNTCRECERPLPTDRLGRNPHRVYHDEKCRELHREKLAEFRELHPELPAQGRSRVKRPGPEDRLRVVRAADNRLAVRVEKEAAKKAVREHHSTDTLPVSYYLADGASAEDAAAFLRESYPPAAEVVL